MASTAETIVAGVRRFPDDVRAELDKALQRHTWEALTREFSIDTFTGLKKEGLDCIPELIDSDNKEFKDDVQKKINVLKHIVAGKAQSFKGRSRIGFYCSFYRFWLVAQRQENELYDILFCHISRKEEFDFFLFLKKAVQGSASVVTSSSQALLSMLPERVRGYLHQGLIQDGGENAEPSVYTHTQLSQELGDRLTEYELVELLIDRGTLVPHTDGTLALRLA